MSMIHEITAARPAEQAQPRKGRGESSGRGKTAGRGNKGARARGGDVHWIPGREGGQTPLFRRFPKRGFSNVNFERRFHIVNLSDLERFDNGATVDAAALIEAGLVPDDRQPVKILGDGEICQEADRRRRLVQQVGAREDHAGRRGRAEPQGRGVRVPQAQEEVREAREKTKKAAPPRPKRRRPPLRPRLNPRPKHLPAPPRLIDFRDLSDVAATPASPRAVNVDRKRRRRRRSYGRTCGCALELSRMG